jgi:ATP-dependent DNA ligase
MQTADESEARAWYGSLHLAGIEGLVVKPPRSRYEPSVRGWLKLKYRSTTEAVIGGVTGDLSRPHELLLGRYDTAGRLHVIGRTTRLNVEAAAEIAGLLTPAGPDHPWPPRLPPAWAGGVYGRPDPISYIQVEPDVVVEVLADVATEHGRYRHPVRFLRSRADLGPAQVAVLDDVEPLSLSRGRRGRQCKARDYVLAAWSRKRPMPSTARATGSSTCRAGTTA